jgi:hypothetical protein
MTSESSKALGMLALTFFLINNKLQKNAKVATTF